MKGVLIPDDLGFKLLKRTNLTNLMIVRTQPFRFLNTLLTLINKMFEQCGALLFQKMNNLITENNVAFVVQFYRPEVWAGPCQFY